MTLIGSDLGKFEHAERVNSLLIAPGERYTVDVRFSGSSVLVNRVQALNHLLGAFTPEVDTLGVIHVDSGSSRPTEYPGADLGAYRQYIDRAVDHRLNLEMRMSTVSNMLTG